MPAGQRGAVQRDGRQNANGNVGRAADDMKRFFLPGVHGALRQMRAFHFLAGQYAAYDHVLDLRARPLDAFHGRAGHNHALRVGLGGDGNIHIILQHTQW